MKKKILKSTAVLCMLFYSVICFSQEIKTVKQALSAIPDSSTELPFALKRGVHLTEYEFPNNVPGISDRIYENLQCTKYFNCEDSEDLKPSLYLKIKLPNSNYTLGAITFGGATDYRVDRVFIADQTGNIKSSMDVCVAFGLVRIKQFVITSDYKLQVYEFVSTSKTSISIDDMFVEGRAFEGYRLDTTYSINSNGQFVKEVEVKHSIKTIDLEKITNSNVWNY